MRLSAAMGPGARRLTGEPAHDPSLVQRHSMTTTRDLDEDAAGRERHVRLWRPP